MTDYDVTIMIITELRRVFPEITCYIDDEYIDVHFGDFIVCWLCVEQGLVRHNHNSAFELCDPDLMVKIIDYVAEAILRGSNGRCNGID